MTYIRSLHVLCPGGKLSILKRIQLWYTLIKPNKPTHSVCEKMKKGLILKILNCFQRYCENKSEERFSSACCTSILIWRKKNLLQLILPTRFCRTFIVFVKSFKVPWRSLEKILLSISFLIKSLEIAKLKRQTTNYVYVQVLKVNVIILTDVDNITINQISGMKLVRASYCCSLELLCCLCSNGLSKLVPYYY